MGETETRPIETDQAEREASGARPYGRYLEDFEVGAVYKHWPAKTVTEADDHLFCLLTMNHHPLHINDVYAAESQQGRNVVVGPLVYSLALGMSVADVSGKAIANLATEELSHPAPVFHGDTLFAESEVLEVRPSQSKPTAAWSRCTRASSSRTARWWPSSSAPCWCRAAERAGRSRRSSSAPIELEESVRAALPAVFTLHESPGGSRDPDALVRVGEQPRGGLGERVGSLGLQIVDAVVGADDAVYAGSVRDHRSSRRERLEHLVLDARSRAGGEDRDRGAMQLGGHARHVGGDLDAVPAPPVPAPPRRAAPPRCAATPPGPAGEGAGSTSSATSRAGSTLWK